MGQGGNLAFEDYQRFFLKGISGNDIPVRDCAGEKRVLVVVGSGYYGLDEDTVSVEFNVMGDRDVY